MLKRLSENSDIKYFRGLEEQNEKLEKENADLQLSLDAIAIRLTKRKTDFDTEKEQLGGRATDLEGQLQQKTKKINELSDKLKKQEDASNASKKDFERIKEELRAHKAELDRIRPFSANMLPTTRDVYVTRNLTTDNVLIMLE